MCTGQGRVDGALCDYSYQDRVDYIKKLKEAGVTNIEMEATVIGSLCNYVGEHVCVCKSSQLDHPCKRQRGDKRGDGLAHLAVSSQLVSQTLTNEMHLFILIHTLVLCNGIRKYGNVCTCMIFFLYVEERRH